MLNRIFRFVIPALVLLGTLLNSPKLEAQQTAPVANTTSWYLSNASGIALDYIASSTIALRNEYCLSVEIISMENLPGFLRSLYDSSFTIESRILYRDAEPYKQQWVFRDRRGIVRINASGDFGSGSEGLLPDEEISGFIEIYDEAHTLISEHQFTDGSEILTIYSYSQGLLIKSDTWMYTPENVDTVYVRPNAMEDQPVITDYYRYTRSYSLRAIERIFHPDYNEITMEKISFPAIIPNIPKEPEFRNPGLTMGTEFLGDTTVPQEQVIFTTDSRGRVITETILGENNEVLGELRNTWSGDRLDSVYMKFGDDERLTEYEYNSNGDRILERNYSRGILERTVRTIGDREIEELYMDGRIILRATWENGRKISEERIR